MVVVRKELGAARVSVTEEPDAGKPHVRICMGGSSQEEFLPCLRDKEKPRDMSIKDHTISDRVISVLVSLIFSIPTAILIWFGVSKNIALYGDGGALGVNILWGLIVGSAVLAFLFPRLFPSILGAVWNGMLKIQKWWGW